MNDALKLKTKGKINENENEKAGNSQAQHCR